MRVAVFSTKDYDEEFLTAANKAHGHELKFLEPRLAPQSVKLAEGAEAVCVFVNDVVNKEVLIRLAAQGIRLIALRCAGFNNVDLKAAGQLGLTVVRVPAYSPYAVAEYTVGMILTLNRKMHRAYNRVREGNFTLDGLLGFDLRNKTAGIIGTGKIGAITAGLVGGFGCRVLANDVVENPDCLRTGVSYVDLTRLYAESDIVSLHCPLMPQTHHMINARAVSQMKRGVMLINTSRGALLDTPAVIAALKSGRIGALGLDVYEEEQDLFFEDLSEQVIKDDVFARLLTFPNVLITGHKAFFTREAMENIAATTMENISAVNRGDPCPNEVTVERWRG